MNLRRRLLVLGGATAMVVSMSVGGSAYAAGAPAGQPRVAAGADPTCIVTSAPSQVETGEGASASSIAVVVTVECQPVYGEQQVDISSPQLFARCDDDLYWSAPTVETAGESAAVTLDDDGNAIAIAYGGPSCAAGRALITADLMVAPFSTAKTYFTILPPTSTKEGVTATPSSEVEDSVYSDAGTVLNIEFPSAYAGDTVEISSPQLAARCSLIGWFGPERSFVGTGSTAYVTLDNDGNAWVAGELVNCAAGKSLITAELAAAPYTTLSTHFTILAPKPTAGPQGAPRATQQSGSRWGHPAVAGSR